MRLVAKISLEHSDGKNIKPQTFNKVLVELFTQSGHGAPPLLSLGIKPKELLIPIEAPVTLYGHLAQQGKLGIKFHRFKPSGSFSTVTKSLQVSITAAPEDVEDLIKMRNAINNILTTSKINTNRGGKQFGMPSNNTAPRRPLASVNNNSAFGMSSASTSFGQRDASSTADSGHVELEDLPSLSGEQEKALRMVKNGKSIFFTGSAGTGKSLLLKHIIHSLPKETTYVTGTTGLAGMLLGGSTINSFAGIGRGEGSIESLIRSCSRGDAAIRWRRCTTLIIDEISMMDGKLWDLLELIARKVRGIERPFGGIQLVISGDFHQLPPVAKDAAARKFCFEAETWWDCIQASIILTQVYRQKDDEFIDILTDIRSGNCSPNTLRSLISRCSRPLDLEDGILPTQLVTHRADVDAINDKQLRELDGDMHSLRAFDNGDIAALAASCPAKATINLKIGAQVMLVRNMDSSKGLVNGARGVVERFSNGGLPVVRFACCDKPITIQRERWNIQSGGRVVAQRTQVPLALAWAVTVHKSQGLTLDRCEVNLEKAFESGMAYVALSRVKSMEGLRILGGINPTAMRADPKVTAFYRDIAGRAFRRESL